MLEADSKSVTPLGWDPLEVVVVDTWDIAAEDDFPWDNNPLTKAAVISAFVTSGFGGITLDGGVISWNGVGSPV